MEIILAPETQNIQSGRRVIQVQQELLGKNNKLAGGNRELFREKGLFVLNVVSSPGSGKTALLERTLATLATSGVRCGVIVGDLATENDARRGRASGGDYHRQHLPPGGGDG